MMLWDTADDTMRKLSHSLFFESDNTKAAEDAAIFKQMMKNLGITNVQSWMVPKADKTITWTVSDCVRKLHLKLREGDGRYLVIGHYAGHGMNATDDFRPGLQLQGGSGSGQAFSWTTIEAIWLGDVVDDAKFDVVMIVDSRYSGLATRAVNSMDRTVEIVAAVSATQSALGNSRDSTMIQNRTFTARLAEQVALRTGRGATAVSFLEIVSALRVTSDPKRMPICELKMGLLPIRVPRLPISQDPTLPPHRRRLNTSSSEGSSSATPLRSVHSAIFKVHLEGINATSPEIMKLVDWIHKLDPSLGIELEGVYQTRSTVIVIRAPWPVWSVLQNLEGFELICESPGGNLLLEGRALSSVPRPTMKENVPFSGH
jgi:hypothetical protein